MKKTKAEFAESKKENLAESDKKFFEQIELPVATSFPVLFPRIFFLVFPFPSYAHVQTKRTYVTVTLLMLLNSHEHRFACCER